VINTIGWLLIIIAGCFIVYTRIWQFGWHLDYTETMMLRQFGFGYIGATLLMLGGYLLIKKFGK